MKTILCIIPNLGTGGAQRVFSNLNRVLSEKYDIVSVAFTSKTGQNQFDNTQTLFLEVDEGTNVLSKLRNFHLRIVRLRRLKKKYNASICISHMEGANYVNMLSGYSKNILVVHGTKLHDGDPDTKFRIANKLLMKILYNYSSRIVTVSKGIMDELIAEFGIERKKILPIPNFFDFDEIQAKSKAVLPDWFKTVKERKKVLIHAGRFHLQKNHVGLIYIFKILRSTHDNIALVLLGDGHLRSEIEKLCSELGLKLASTGDYSDADVFIFGNVDNPYSFIANSDLFLFPSKWEGFPMALCEALICKTRVVSSDCPTGPNEILPKEKSLYGSLLPVPTSDSIYWEWAKEITSLLSLPSKTVDLKWEEPLKDKISKEAIKKKWFSLIESIHV